MESEHTELIDKVIKENDGEVAEKKDQTTTNEGETENEPLLDNSRNGIDTEDAIKVDSVSEMNAKKKEMKLDLLSVVKQTQHVQIEMDRLKLQNQPSTGPLKIAVFIKTDRKAGEGGRVLTLDKNGKLTTAGDIKDEMLDLLSIPKESAHLFSIWFISAYLELQLKCHHVPFFLRKQWRDLLKKLTDCPKDELTEDEPVLVFQRNSFITVAEEKKETEHNVLKRLFEEASYNVMKARYPVPVNVAERLGGILLRCYEGEYDPEKHKPGFFKKRLNEFLPYYAIGSNKISQYIYSSGADQRLINEYRNASKDLEDKIACYKEYLEECHKLDFYGSAFFKGTCFLEGANYKIWKSEQQQITIGLNRCGITLFKGVNDEVLTHLRYREFCWKLDEYDRDEDGNKIERFLIEYDDEEGTRQIQIISKQACLMDAMVSSCNNFMEDILASNDNTMSRKKLHYISYRSTSTSAEA